MLGQDCHSEKIIYRNIPSEILDTLSAKAGSRPTKWENQCMNHRYFIAFQGNIFFWQVANGIGIFIGFGFHGSLLFLSVPAHSLLHDSEIPVILHSLQSGPATIDLIFIPLLNKALSCCLQ